MDDDFDARIAQAINSAKNQTPIPALKSPMSKKQAKKLNGNTPPTAPAPAPTLVPAVHAPAVAVADPFDLFDSLISNASAAPATAPTVLPPQPQVTQSPVKQHMPYGTISDDDVLAGEKGSPAGKSAKVRKGRGYSQDIIKQRVESPKTFNALDVGVEALARRTSLISGMAAETVNYQSSYEGRHISPSVGSRSRSGSATASFTRESASACSPDGTAETATGVNQSPLFHNDSGNNFVEYGRMSQERESVDAETFTNAYYRNKIGAALTSELLEKLGKLPPENPWSLDCKDVMARGAYLPKEMRIVRTDNIQVALRVRPFTHEEVSSGARRCVSLCDDHRKLVLVNPSVPVFEVDKLAEAVDTAATFSKEIASVHTFDDMFWSAEDRRRGTPVANNKSLYADIGEKLVGDAMKGISSVCCAYGETKSGKTFSLYGADGAGVSNSDANGASLDGLLAKSFSAIVERAGKLGDTKCTLSFVEIYNEKIHDLLGSCKISSEVSYGNKHDKHAQVSRNLNGGIHGMHHQDFATDTVHKESHINSLVFRATHHRRHSARVELKVREHPLLGPYVDGMRQLRVKSTADVLAVVQEAQAERAWLHEVCNTRANCGTVLATLELTPLHDNHRQLKDSGGLQRTQKVVRVHMVDLAAAPSESISAHWRTSVKTASKPQLKYEKVINISMNGRAAINAPKNLDEVKVVRRSLAHLNYILHSIERGALMHLLPFRDSVLTWLLRGTLVLPTSRIAMIAHISPGDRNYEETCRSIKYAERLCMGRTQRSAWVSEDAKWSNSGVFLRSQTLKMSSKGASGTPAKPNTARFSTSLRAPANLIASTGASDTLKHAAATSAEAVRKLDRRFADTMSAAHADANLRELTMPSKHRDSPDKEFNANAVGITEYSAVLRATTANDSPEVASLKNTVIDLQKALEQSHAQRNLLQAENETMVIEFKKLAERLQKSLAKEQALVAELEIMDSVLLEAAQEAQVSSSAPRQQKQEVAPASGSKNTSAQMEEVRMQALAMHRKQQLLQEQRVAEERERRAIEKALMKQEMPEEDEDYLDDIIEEEVEEAEEGFVPSPQKYDFGVITPSSKSVKSNAFNAPDSDLFGYRINIGTESPGSEINSSATDGDVVSPTRTEELEPGDFPGADIGSANSIDNKARAETIVDDDDIEVESSPANSPVSKSVVRKFVNREEDAVQYKPAISVAHHLSEEHIDAAAAPLDHIGDSELDEQIAKLSKFLVRDKSGRGAARPRKSRDTTPEK